MKRALSKISALVALLLVMTLSACRTNNGDIGLLYGEWVLSSLTVNDQPNLCSNNFIRFQNNIVEVTVLADDHNYNNVFGTWTREADILMLDFSGIFDEDGQPKWSLGELGLSGYQKVKRFEIVSESRRTLILRCLDSEGNIFVYTYDKLI